MLSSDVKSESGLLPMAAYPEDVVDNWEDADTEVKHPTSLLHYPALEA